MKKVNTLIIGSGISGLAYAANTDDDYLILEKDSSPGGLCRTFYVDGFVWDYAGHLFHFVNPHLKKKFELDVWYVDHISFLTDCKVILTTLKKVIGREDINSATSATMEFFNGNN